MIEILQFIFSDLLHFTGTVILLMLLCPWNQIKIERKGKGDRFCHECGKAVKWDA